MVNSIGISPHCSACHIFTDEVSGLARTRTVWLSPTEIAMDKDKVRIIWRCSLSKFCMSLCAYSDEVKHNIK